MKLNSKYPLTPDKEALVQERLEAALRLLGAAREQALLEVKVEAVPAQGRSSEPCRVAARLSVGGDIFYAEAVKPSPESAADRVRAELEAEIRRRRGRARRLLRTGSTALKRMLRSYREDFFMKQRRKTQQ